MPASRGDDFGQFLTASAVAALPWLRVDGAAVSERAVRRWFDREGPGRLRSAKLGGRRVTCEAWLIEFIERDGEGTEPAAGRTPTRRRKAIESATAALEAEGF